VVALTFCVTEESAVPPVAVVYHFCTPAGPEAESVVVPGPQRLDGLADADAGAAGSACAVTVTDARNPLSQPVVAFRAEA